MARKTSTAERVLRLVALLGRLKNGVRLPLADLARAVGATPAELTADLETLSLCGVAPYDPYASVPVLVEGGFVEVWGDMPAPTGSVRLSPAQASALASALQAAGFSSSDALTQKLFNASGTDFDAEDLERTLRSSAAAHSGLTYETLALAIEERGVAEIEHTSADATRPSLRTIEPVALFGERDAWYVTAWCRTAGAWRTFRLDRIRSVRRTGASFPERADRPTTDRAFQATDLPVATLRFAADEPFSEREWPGGVAKQQEADGSLVVEVPFCGTRWIARRVVARLGTVEVVSPAEVRDAVRELASATAR